MADKEKPRFSADDDPKLTRPDFCRKCGWLWKLHSPDMNAYCPEAGSINIGGHWPPQINGGSS